MDLDAPCSNGQNLQAGDKVTEQHQGSCTVHGINWSNFPKDCKGTRCLGQQKNRHLLERRLTAVCQTHMEAKTNIKSLKFPAVQRPAVA